METFASTSIRDNLHLFLDHFGRLTPEDRYCRFFHTTSPSSIRDWLIRLTEDPDSHFLLVEKNEQEDFVGIAQLAIEDKICSAEIAISVLPECRGKGIASKLVVSAIRHAEAMGLESATYKCEPANHPCRKLYDSLGFSSKYDSEEGCITGRLILRSGR